MNYTSHNHWIFDFFQTNVGNGWRNSLKIYVFHISSFVKIIKIAFSQLQLIYMFQTTQSWDFRYMN